MICETAKEIKRCRKSARAVKAALDAMQKAVKPGISTLELDQICAKVLAEYGSKAGPPRVYHFPGNSCISINEQALHGIPTASVKLKDGDLVKLDLVAELGGVYTDAAITVMVGEGTETDKRLIACAQEAFHAGLSMAQVGMCVNEIGRAIENVITKFGFSALQGFGGHGIGKTVHEVPYIPNTASMGIPDVLQNGMLLTLEPIVCEKLGEPEKLSDGWTIVTKDRGRTAHYEHTLIVTTSGPMVLTN
jgi:methionyl aminopeptidase